MRGRSRDGLSTGISIDAPEVNTNEPVPRHRCVLTEAQTRILARLSEFSESLETAWDVPRSLSLPGLAESLGVVRSALHSPLSSLEEKGMVSTRNAHVIGGGSRRRTVVHITQEGRHELEESGYVSMATSGMRFGPVPEPVVVSGRVDEIDHIASSISCLLYTSPSPRD